MLIFPGDCPQQGTTCISQPIHTGLFGSIGGYGGGFHFLRYKTKILKCITYHANFEILNVKESFDCLYYIFIILCNYFFWGDGGWGVQNPFLTCNINYQK